MMRFLGIYPVAIIVALAIATFVSRHPPQASMAKPAPVVLQTAAVTPPAASAAYQPVTEAIDGDRGGQFTTLVQIDGRDLHMLLDTGATYLSLTNEDARELGLRPAASEFNLRMQTANGIASAARVWLPHVRVGNVQVHDVEAIVMSPGATQTSLLGMSFLGKLHRFGVANGRMHLEQ